MSSTPTPPPDWPAVRRLFEAVSALPPAERAVLLADPAHPAAVVAEVLSLLAHADDDGRLDRPAQPAAEAAALAEASPAGQRLGAWRLATLLGRGGMGEVWAAERDDGRFQGRAAVKLLSRGHDSAAVLARFAQEQQALARLQHPHIAHLLDAGLSAGGRPFFVMELVDGQPIDRACEGLPLPQKLALFLQLADAVAHAHRQLLVHRDLKPGNVLVNREGQVKLLDFGIAKALDPLDADADAITRTQAGERPFTPQYASPEQVRGEPVGTATDIYSLGVLLYVMLTGVRPYGRSAATPFEAARSVLDEEPTRPSALSPEQVADPQWLATRRRLRGDLDNILLKALDKRIGHRYASVDALAADVRAHLAGYPVSARAPRPAYVLAKFVARHRAATVAGVLALLSLVGGLAATGWQVRQTELQRQAAERRFEQVRGLAKRLLFDYHDQIQLLPGSTAVRERMLEDARSHLDALSSEAAGQPALQRELGVAWRRLGELHHAESRPGLGSVQTSLQMHSRALALLNAALAGEAPGTPGHQATRWQLALALKAEAVSLRSAGQPRQALPRLQAAAELFDALATEAPQDKSIRIEQVRAQLNLSEVFGGAGSGELADAARAQAHLQAAVARVGPVSQAWPGDADVLALHTTTHNLLWLGQFSRGELAEGLATLRANAPVFERMQALEPDNTLFRRDAAVNLLSQGTALRALQRWPEALQASSEALRRMQALAAADPANRVAGRDVAKLQTDVALAEFRLQRTGAAAERLALAITQLDALVRHDPQDRRVARLLALAHAQRAEVQAARGQGSDVARHATLALEGAARLAAAAPDDVGSTVLRATVHTQLGGAWRSLPGASAATRACAEHRAAMRLWEGLQAEGRLTPMQASGPLVAAREGAAPCRG